MEVTRHNFHDLLPDIEAAIDACDFLSIDGEFSGLTSGIAINPFDTPPECYESFKNGSKDFLLIQFGLSIFRWDVSSQSYKHIDFTFYLFPRQEIKSAPDKIFSCQTSSIDFLAKHKFDFNKLFYDGVSYVDTVEETRLRERLTEKQVLEKEMKLSTNNDSLTKNIINIPENFQSRMDQICEDVEKFLDENQEKQIEFDNLNAFQRKIVFQELELKFGKSIYMETKVLINNKRLLIVLRGIKEDELKKRIDDAHAKEWEEMEAAIGFSIIARKISNSNKLVVGHCMILDMLHTVNNFFHPLPDNYSNFKMLTSNLFTGILDTMYLIKSNTVKEHFTAVDLASMFTTVSKEPFKLPKIEIESSEKSAGYLLDDKHFHMSGYDAFITGVSLTSLFEYLKCKNFDNIQGVDNDRLSLKSVVLKPYLNKLFLYKTSYQASPCINLSGQDPFPSRDHVFHIVFPSAWTRNDIAELFDPYGGASVIAFINDTSAYVALKQHSQAIFAKTTLCQQNSDYKVVPFWKSKEMILHSMKNDIIHTSSTRDTNSKSDITTINSFEAQTSSNSTSDKKAPKRKIDDKIDTSNAEQDSEDHPRTEAEEKHRLLEDSSNNTLTKNGKPQKRQRKLSHTSAGSFVVSQLDKKNASTEKKTAISSVFRESDSWD